MEWGYGRRVRERGRDRRSCTARSSSGVNLDRHRGDLRPGPLRADRRARRSAAGATRSSSPPRSFRSVCPCRSGRARGRARGGSASTASTCTSCTGRARCFRLRATMPRFKRLVDDGLVAHVGVSNSHAEAVGRTREARWRASGALQPGAVQPRASRAGARAACRGRRRRVGSSSRTARSARACCRASTRTRRRPTSAACGRDFRAAARARLAPLIAALEEIGNRHRATPAQVALAWLIRKPNVVAIPGASSVQPARGERGRGGPRPDRRRGRAARLARALGRRMRLEAVELRRIGMPLVAPFETSFGVQIERDILLVKAITSEGEGWGECVAGEEPTYSPEYVDGAQHVLDPPPAAAAVRRASLAADDVVGAAAAGARPPDGEGRDRDGDPRRASCARAANRSRKYFGAVRDAVDCGVSVGIHRSIPELLRDGRRLPRAGLPADQAEDQARLGRRAGARGARAFRRRAAAGGREHRVLARPTRQHLAELDAFDLLLIEQPLPEEQVLAHARAGQDRAHADLPRRVDPFAAGRRRRDRAGRVPDHQHQARPGRRLPRGAADPRPVRERMRSRSGWAACSRPASAAPATWRWRRCRTSRCPATRRRRTATTTATSPSRSCCTTAG